MLGMLRVIVVAPDLGPSDHLRPHSHVIVMLDAKPPWPRDGLVLNLAWCGLH